MIRITITPSLSDLSARYSRAAQYLPELVGHALMQAGDEAQQALRDASPVGIGRTGGHLASSFFSRQIDPLIVIVGSDQPLKLGWVTHGTASPILPVVKKFLYWPELGHPIAWVHGQDPNDFVTPVQERAQEMLDAQVPDLLRYIEVLLTGA